MNRSHLLYVLVVESETTAGPRTGLTKGRTLMLARPGPSHPAQGADLIARAVGALALGALAVIHVIDLPATLGPTPLIGIGYLGIIAAAVSIGAVMISRAHWLSWAAAG